MSRVFSALVILLLSHAVLASGAFAQTSFYQTPNSLLSGNSGTIIRQERMGDGPDGSVAYRVLYRSTGLKGEMIAVSGVVIVPKGSTPPGGRPIVAWAHPTSGVIPRCAP